MRLLLIEDEPDIGRQLKSALTDAGYVVDLARDGEEGQFLGETEPYDAVVLDLGLPKVDGVSVLERWRRAGLATPVLILTARGAWSDKVAGFDAGADDYLTKPFHTEELLARLRALLRRAAGHAQPQLSCGDLRLDPKAARASVNGEPLRLTSLEYRLLHYMIMHNERVISRTELVEHLYDQDFDRDSNTIEVFIGRLRKKVGADRCAGWVTGSYPSTRARDRYWPAECDPALARKAGGVSPVAGRASGPCCGRLVSGLADHRRGRPDRGLQSRRRRAA